MQLATSQRPSSATDRAESVLRAVEALVDDVPLPDGLRGALRVQLDEVATHGTGRGLPFVEIPWATARCAGASEDVAVRIAGMCTVVYAGADLLDNVADDELPDRWSGHGPEIATLAGATLVSSLVTRCLQGLETHDISERSCWEITKEVATGLLEMSRGQYLDLSEQPSSVADCLQIAEAKAGGELALFARVGAMAGDATVETISSFSEMGRAYGTAIQILSDAHDLWAGEGRDLANGKVTVPIAHALEVLDGEPRDRLRALLAQRGPRPALLELLRGAGSLHYTGMVAEVYRQRALHYLRLATPKSAAAEDLQRLIDAASLARTRSKTEEGDCVQK